MIGIDKALKIIRLTGRPLLEIEHLLRPWSNVGFSYADKMSLPWRVIGESPLGDVADHEDEWERLTMDFEHDEQTKRNKGGSRKALHEWRLGKPLADQIKAGFVGYEGKRKRRLIAECRILADALRVIGGRMQRVPANYPKEIEGILTRKDRAKVALVISESRAIPGKRKLILKGRLQRAKDALTEHDEKRKHLAFEVELWSERKKKWGKGMR